MSNYENYRANAGLSLMKGRIEDIYGFLYDNLFLLKIGIVESFDKKNQIATCTVKHDNFDGVLIKAKFLQNFLTHELKKGQKVILIQTITNLENEASTNYFDRGNFSILSVLDLENVNVKLKKIVLEVDELEIKAQNPIEIKTDNANLADLFQKIVDALSSLKVVGQAQITPDFMVNVNTIMAEVSKILK